MKDPASYFKVIPADFEDALTIIGYVEPTQSVSVVCPARTEGALVWIIADGTFVEVGDTLAIIKDSEQLSNYNNDLTNLENAEAELIKSKADLQMQYALMEAQVKTNQAETDIANLDSLQLQYLSPNQRKIKMLELEKTGIEKQKLHKKLKALGIINSSEVRKLEMRIRRFTSTVENSKRRLDALVLTAPQSGIVIIAKHMITQRKTTVGDPIWDNMPVITIPESKKMKVQIVASEGNYKRINVKDSVAYTFDAIPDNTATGKITMKSPVGQPVQKDSKVKTFEIEASIDSSLKAPEPGYSANCKIILKRVPDTIVIPQVAVYEIDSIKSVYVKTTDGYELRQIITGSSSSATTIVVAGLKRNETISLIEPPSKLIKKKTLLPDLIIKKYKNHK